MENMDIPVGIFLGDKERHEIEPEIFTNKMTKIVQWTEHLYRGVTVKLPNKGYLNLGSGPTETRDCISASFSP